MNQFISVEIWCERWWNRWGLEENEQLLVTVVTMRLFLFYFNLFFLWTCKNLEHFLPNGLDMRLNGALTRAITTVVTKTTEETPNKQWAVEWRKLELFGITPQSSTEPFFRHWTSSSTLAYKLISFLIDLFCTQCLQSCKEKYLV